MQSSCCSVYRNSLVFLASATLKLAFVISHSILVMQIFIFNDDSAAKRGGNPPSSSTSPTANSSSHTVTTIGMETFNEDRPKAIIR